MTRDASRGDPDSNVALLEIALQLQSTLDLNELLSKVLSRMVDLLKAERALFALFDKNRRIEKAVLHNLEWQGRGTALPISRGVIEAVFAEPDMIQVRDAEEDPEFNPSESWKFHGLHFAFAVAVRCQRRVAGVLYVDSRVPAIRDVSKKSEVLKALAAVVGVAVENAQLFEGQRFRAFLLRQLVHDFRTPLTVIKANSEMLMAMPDELPVGEMSQDMASHANRMVRMMDNTLQLSKIDAGVMTSLPERVDIERVLTAQTRAMAIIARNFEVTFDVQVPADLQHPLTVLDRLYNILDNLIFNALKYARSGSVVEVSARMRDDIGPEEALLRESGGAASLFLSVDPLEPEASTPFVEVSIKNLGPPIPEHMRSRLFNEFEHGEQERVRDFASTGLGLAIVDQTVRHLGGAVWFNSGESDGTRFLFTLPTALHQPSEAK